MKHLPALVLLFASMLLSCTLKEDTEQVVSDNTSSTEAAAQPQEPMKFIMGNDTICCVKDSLYSMIENAAALSIDSISKDAVVLKYPQHIVVSTDGAEKTAKDTLKVVANANADVYPAVTISKVQVNESIIEEGTEKKTESPIVWFILIGGGVLGVLVCLFFLKRSKNGFKIKIRSKAPDTFSKDQKLYWNFVAKTKNKNKPQYFCGEIEIVKEGVNRDMVTAWLIKNYYATENIDQIKQIKDCISNLDDKIEKAKNNTNILIFPLLPVSECAKAEGDDVDVDPDENRLEGSERQDEDTPKDRKPKKKDNKNDVIAINFDFKEHQFKAVPASIQKLDAELGPMLIEETDIANLKARDNNEKTNAAQAESIIANLIENDIEDEAFRKLASDYFNGLKETKSNLEKKESTIKNQQNEIQRLNGDLKKEKDKTRTAVEEATKSLKEENDNLKESENKLKEKNENLMQEKQKLNFDLNQAKSTIETLEGELSTSRAQFTEQKECKPFAGNLQKFFGLLDILNKDAENVLCKLSANGGKGAAAMAEALKNYRASINGAAEIAHSLKLDSSLISITGFDLAASDLNKRLQSQKDKTAREKDFRYFVYDKLNGLMGDAVIFADIVKHLDMTHGVDPAPISSFKDMPERLIAAIKILGYEIEYVELFTPYTKYENVNVVESTDDAVLDQDAVAAVKRLAVNYGTSSKKTEVIAKI